MSNSLRILEWVVEYWRRDLEAPMKREVESKVMQRWMVWAGV